MTTYGLNHKLSTDENLSFVVTAEQWDETQHELHRRRDVIVVWEHLTPEWVEQTWRDIQAHVDDNAVRVASRQEYAHLESIGRRRIPRDPNDWPTVALAIALDAGILTKDLRFPRLWLPNLDVETLRAELAAS